jgi:hypothetical protein
MGIALALTFWLDQWPARRLPQLPAASYRLTAEGLQPTAVAPAKVPGSSPRPVAP